MNDFSLKKTRILVVASIFWLAISFYFADTGYLYDYFDFMDVKWELFLKLGAPVWIYWTYLVFYWIKKGR